MNRQIKNISKDIIIRKYYIKLEFKKLILKSIIQNKSLNATVRFHANFKIKKLNSRTNISKQVNSCILTGKHGSVFKFINLSRQTIKKLNNSGLINNIRISAW